MISLLFLTLLLKSFLLFTMFISIPRSLTLFKNLPYMQLQKLSLFCFCCHMKGLFTHLFFCVLRSARSWNHGSPGFGTATSGARFLTTSLFLFVEQQHKYERFILWWLFHHILSIILVSFNFFPFDILLKKITEERKMMSKKMPWNMIQNCNYWSMEGCEAKNSSTLSLLDLSNHSVNYETDVTWILRLVYSTVNSSHLLAVWHIEIGR